MKMILKQTAYRFTQVLCLLPLVLFVIFCTTSGAETGHAPQEITEDMTCPVCNMYPARYPTWHTQVIFKDGNFAVFDGCKDYVQIPSGDDKIR